MIISSPLVFFQLEATTTMTWGDTPVAEVSKQDIKRLLEAVEGLPKQNKRLYNKMTVQECLELDDVPEDDLVTLKTVKDYLKLCQSFFSAFLTKEKDILRSSPTDNVPFVFKSKPYGDYSDTEMQSLVASVRRPLNRPHREDRICLLSWGQSSSVTA
ncbi:TPA: hypothetical protein ACG0BA_004815 [Serratia odorifera]